MASLSARLDEQGLRFSPATARAELMSPAVHVSLAETGADALIAPVRDEDSDTSAFCERFGLSLDSGANCVVVEGERRGDRVIAACVALGVDRIDLNGAVRRALGARKGRMAPAEVLRDIDMESGGVSPFGLPREWQILVDHGVAASEELIVGSGLRNAKLLVPGRSIAALPNAVTLHLVRRPGVPDSRAQI